MSDALKVRVLFSILSLAPMTSSKPDFEAYASVGDLTGFWRYYLNCLSAKRSVGDSVEVAGEISFEMLRPAMDSVYRL